MTAATYSKTEEALNIWSHFIGIILALCGIPALYFKSQNLAIDEQLSVLVFGVSMVLLFSASTLYHAARKPHVRSRLRVLDHCAIFIFIAASYTPFALLVLKGETGWWMFSASWLLAALGVILKLFFTGRFKLLSTAVYVFMGWIIVFAGKTLIASFPQEGLLWLLAGGMSYTLGAVLYSFKRLQFSHAIFHVMVLIGCGCHFYALYQFVLK